MTFIETGLKGAFIVEPEFHEDERGFFARSFCRNEFEEQGLNLDWVQSNISFNRSKGTLRGMHYQAKPSAEAKLIRCTAGAVFDVIVDLRPESQTFRQWFSVELTMHNYLILYIPEGFAHGFQTLADDTELVYQHSRFYSPEHERGLRYDDPALNISWPLPVTVVSAKDRAYPLINEKPSGREV